MGMFDAVKIATINEIRSEISNRLAEQPSTQVEVLAAAIAVAVATSVPLPPAAYDSSAVAYNNPPLNQAISNYVSRINEDVLFNTERASALIRSLWMVRYDTAFSKLMVNGVTDTTGSFIENFTGASYRIAKDDAILLCSHHQLILSVARKIYQLYIVDNNKQA